MAQNNVPSCFHRDAETAVTSTPDYNTPITIAFADKNDRKFEAGRQRKL
jgi:hypothetical protein